MEWSCGRVRWTKRLPDETEAQKALDSDSGGPYVSDPSTETDSASDNDSDADVDADVDTDTDTDSDTDVDADTDTDPDTDSIGPCTLGTYEGDYTIASFSDGAGHIGYTNLRGTLTISGKNATIEGLFCIEVIEKDLIVKGTELKELAAFERLSTVGGSMRIEENPLLENLEFKKLAAVSVQLKIRADEQLLSVTLPVLTSPIESIHVESNNRLASLFVPAVEEIGQMMFVNQMSQVMLNFSGLRQIADLNFLTADITALSGFDALEAVDGTLYLMWCKNLAAVSLSSLRRLGAFHLSQNEALQTLDFLSLVETMDAMVISENSVLQRISGMENLKFLGSLAVYSNEQLGEVSMDALEKRALKDASGVPYFHISDNPRMESGSFHALTEINGYFEILDAPALSELDLGDIGTAPLFR